jgi:AmiR/NasT family two-component response regulator
VTASSPDSNRTVLFVGSDLMARERIRSAAAHLQMMSVSSSVTELLGALEKHSVDVVVIDLDEGREAVLVKLEEARAAGHSPPAVVGFYSHVDADLGRAAERAGCRAVRRGRFWSSLPDLLRRYDHPEGDL